MIAPAEGKISPQIISARVSAAKSTIDTRYIAATKIDRNFIFCFWYSFRY
uniref:Uncharacterized protein n=1 Tax=Anopheles funestus TaxID=62324 RepID=A0A4Y0BHV5_ANOFN